MKISVELSAVEWATEREMLAVHLSEMLEQAPFLTKSQGPPVERRPHPVRAVAQITRGLVNAYQAMCDDLLNEVVAYLSDQKGQEPH